jgi:hypothetical protein
MSHPLYDLLLRLEDAKIAITISRNRSDSLLVTLALVGERIEIDVFEDGHMEVSSFTGSEGIVGGAEVLEKLIARGRG